MTVVPTSRQERQAPMAADAADRAFFAANPGREYHARPSLQFEGEGWGADSHITSSVMVVARLMPGQKKFDRIPMGAASDGVTDNELFLGLLWRHVATMGAAGGGISISPETHRQLLEVAGLANGVLK